MELLWQHILTTQAPTIGKSHELDLSFQLAGEKMQKYYFIDQLSPIICASILLHPNMDNFFEDVELRWGLRPEWKVRVKELVTQLWQSSYSTLALHNISIASTLLAKENLNQHNSSFSGLRNFKQPRLVL